MYSKVKIAGHPLHPMLIAFPVALYTVTLIAFAICFVVGVLLGLPALRLSGPYLALATFAFAVSVPQLPLEWSKFLGTRIPPASTRVPARAPPPADRAP